MCQKFYWFLRIILYPTKNNNTKTITLNLIVLTFRGRYLFHSPIIKMLSPFFHFFQSFSYFTFLIELGKNSRSLFSRCNDNEYHCLDAVSKGKVI